MSERTSLGSRPGTHPAARPVTYLRVSVTDRCGFRCFYCSPAEERSAAARALSPADIERVVRISQRLGVTHVRLTGGEPLERPDVVEIVRRLAGLGLAQLSLTTNGVRLVGLADALRRAGLTRVNVSLPHTEAEGFRRITGRDALSEVLAGIRAAQDAGLAPVKTNTVVLRGYNDQAACDLVEFGRREGLTVRFIEYMTSEDRSAREHFVPACETLARLRRRFRLEEAPTAYERDQADGPARYYRLAEGGLVGFISPLSEPFCARCNRLRLTSTGKLRPCLYDEHEVDLLPALRSPSWERDLEGALHLAVSLKPGEHNGRLPKAMRFIGG